MIHRRWLLVLAVLALPSPASVHAREGSLEIVCSSPALASIARRIAGERAAVSCAVPPGKDSSTWRPDAKAARAMQKADLVVLNGAGLEAWIDHVSLPATRRVVTTKGLGSALLMLDEVITHSHGPEGEHSHQGENPHTWLDPRIAAKQARTLLDAMIRRDPPGEKTYTAGYESLAADLGKLDGELAAMTRRHAPVALLVSHPTWDYPAKSHGWKLHAVDADPEKPLGEKARAQLTRALASVGVPALLLWEAPAAASTVRELEALGVKCLVLDPGKLHRGDEELDLVRRIRENTRALDAALTEVSGGSR